MIAQSCIGFEIPCETLLKGGLTTIMAFVLFVGSVLLMLSFVFGRRMGYLVLAVSFFAWMIILSVTWLTGFIISQGLDTPVNLGPRGAEPAWVIEAAGTDPQPVYEVFDRYPDGEGWREPGENDNDTASIQAVTSSAQAFLAERGERGPRARRTRSPARSRRRTSSSRTSSSRPTSDVSLAAAEGYFTGGGPLLKLYMRHDSGSVNRYSWMFLIGSVVGLGGPPAVCSTSPSASARTS